MRAFSLVELLVVVACLAVLGGLSYGGYGVVRRRAAVGATAEGLQALAVAIAAYPGRNWPVLEDHDGNPATPAVARRHRLWDANGDGLLDGRPDADPGTPAFPAALVASGYPGALGLVRVALPAVMKGADGRPLDAWGRPVRYRELPAGRGAALTSAGPDGLFDTPDDIDTEQP